MPCSRQPLSTTTALSFSGVRRRLIGKLPSSTASPAGSRRTPVGSGEVKCGFVWAETDMQISAESERASRRIRGESITCYSSQMRKPNLTHEFRKPWVGPHRIEPEVGPQALHLVIALFVGGGEPAKDFVFFSQPSVENGDFVGRGVAGLPLCLPDFDAFGQGLLPSPGVKALFESRGKLHVLRVPIQLTHEFVFFHHLRVHAFSPIGLD